MQPYTVACLQAQVRVARNHGERDEAVAENVSRAASYIDFFSRHTNRGPRLVVLPELFLQGHALARTSTDPAGIAIDLDGPELGALRQVTDRYGILVAGSALEHAPAAPGGCWHTAFIVGPDGVILRYRVPLEDQRQPVDGVPWVDTDYGRLACVFLDDLDGPETVRQLAAQDVEVLVNPIYEPYNEHQVIRDAVRRTRAFESCVYLVTVNQGVGLVPGGSGPGTSTTAPIPPDAGLAFDARGYSQVIDFRGRPLMVADGAGETMLTATIDLERLRAERDRLGAPVRGFRASPTVPANARSHSAPSADAGTGAIAPLT